MRGPGYGRGARVEQSETARLEDGGAHVGARNHDESASPSPHFRVSARTLALLLPSYESMCAFIKQE